MRKLLFLCITVCLSLLASCSEDTICIVQENAASLSSNEEYVNAVKQAANYFREKGAECPLLAERDYNSADIKYGLASCWKSGNDIGMQFPLIKGKLTDPGIIYNITKQRNRDYLYVVMTRQGDVKSIYLATEEPNDECYQNERKHIRYHDFTGTKKVYSSTNRFARQISFYKGKNVQTRSLTDSIFELPEVIINGVDVSVDHFYNGRCQFCKMMLIYSSDKYSMICPECFFNLEDSDINSGYCLSTGSWTTVKGFMPTEADKHDAYEERNSCTLQVICNIINFFEQARLLSAGQILIDYCNSNNPHIRN